MRNLDRALMVHKDHVSAVYVAQCGLTWISLSICSMDVSYSPTGREFVSGSYDRTIRIFNVRSAKSREVYHTKRMQRIFAVKFSADSKFVLSGSDDTNIRIWKAEASKHLGKLAPRERKQVEYKDALKKRFQHLTEVRRIAKHRHVPKAIKKASMAKQEANERDNKKLENRRKHSRPGKVPYVDTRKKTVIRNME